MTLNELKTFANCRGFTVYRFITGQIAIRGHGLTLHPDSIEGAVGLISKAFVKTLQRRIEKGDHIRISLEDEFFNRSKRQPSL